MNNYCVYKHTSPTGKVYIGVTCQQPEKRWGGGHNYHGQHFANAIKKHGWDNFTHEILHKDLSREDADKLEIELIAFYDSTNPKCGYNVDPGGNNKPAGEENPLFGKRRPEWVVKKMSEARRGKPWSETQRKSREEYNKTHKAWNYGKKTPAEIVEKLRVSHIGQCRPHSESTKRKLSEANNKRKKPVAQYSLSGEYITTHESVRDAARSIKFDKHVVENIRQNCHGKKKNCIWLCLALCTGGERRCMTLLQSKRKSTVSTMRNA